MKLHIVNGPNLNLLGKREPGIYGKTGFEEYFARLKNRFPSVEFTFFQSNVEGELINSIQEADTKCDGIILNAAAYTHTSVAIADSIAAIKTAVIEVHISNVYAREEFRHVSLLAKNCAGIITGFGLDSYRLAVEAFLAMQAEAG